jgi:predicted transposase/invertase (TIGR01784 family)
MEALDRMTFKAYKPIFEKLEKIVDISALSKEDRLRYDRSIRNYRDTLATLSFAEQKGLNKGLEKGMEKGLSKGRKEEKIEIARNMKAKGFTTENIVEITGLSEKEVEKL